MKLYFQRRAGVSSAPLSIVNYEGEMNPHLDILAQEYIIVCGDIGTGVEARDEALQKLRDEMAEMGCEIEIMPDECGCDICQCYGEGRCQDDDPDFDPQEI